MARLPTYLDLSGPESTRSGRVIASYDESAIGRGLAQFGDGIQSVGASLQVKAKEEERRQNALDITRADAYAREGFLGVENEFANDPDYATYGKRAPEKTGGVVRKAGELIRDPKARELWLASANGDAAQYNDKIYDKGTATQRAAEVVAFDDALEVNRRIYVDPDSPDDARAKAKQAIEASISMGEEVGLLDPVEADARRKTFVEDAEFSRGKLAIERDPSIINRPVGYGDARLPAGMRNNNPGNIKFVGQGAGQGVVGPSENTDQGEPQAVFSTPEAGMKAAYDLALRKYRGGKTTANQLIAGDNGWTPGNYEAAKNIAATAGLGPDDDLNLSDPESAQRFMRALVTQEHGKSSRAYSDEMIASAVSGVTKADLPIVFGDTSGRVSAPDMSGVHPAVLTRFKALQNTFGRSLPIVSGFRDAKRNERAAGAKASQHLGGNALDIDVSSLSQDERIQLIKSARQLGFGGIGVYGNSIHVDTGSVRAWGASHHSDTIPAWAREAVGTPRGGTAVGERPDWYKNVSPEQRQAFDQLAETRSNQISVEQRAIVETATTNAPAAIMNTGSYAGALPTAEQFNQAYGEYEGPDRYDNFVAAMDVSEKAYSMQTMSAGDIQQMVNDAKPVSSGDDAALETKRYEALSSAADTTIKAREADPAKYVRQAFPAVDTAWDNVNAAPENYGNAVALSVAAQEQLGVTDIKPLPKDATEYAVTKFKDPNLPEGERMAAVSTAMMSTPDPTQQRAIFEQMVDAGLPDSTEGAFGALSRGDTGAARRLFKAAMVDPTKLPGKISETPAAIDAKIQSTLMDAGQVGDVYYGLTDGTAENMTRAERDSKLINNAVNLRMRNGEDLDAAIAGVSKDLYGDVQVVEGDGRVNVQVLAPSNVDPQKIVDGLTAVMPQVKDAIARKVTVPVDAPTSDGTKAVLDATTSAYVENVLAEGFFRTSGDGYVFIDPYRGKPVSDANGKPIIFKPPMVIPPESDSSAPLTDDAFDRFQKKFGTK